MGELPAPAPLPPSVASGGDPEAAYAAIGSLAADARSGGAAGVAAWEALFARSGIAIMGPDGTALTANGDTGFGMPMSEGELRIAAALAASPGQIPLTEVADMMSPLVPGVATEDLAAMMYQDLSVMADLDARQVFWVVGPGQVRDGKLLTAEEMTLSWGQVELLMRRFAAEAEVLAISQGEDFPGELTATTAAGPATSAGGGATVAEPAAYVAVAAAQGKRPCATPDDPWGQNILTQAQKAESTVFDKALEYVASKAEKVAESGSGVGGTAGRVGLIFTWARPMLAALSLLGKVVMLTPDFSLADAPLVRTKDTTPGQVRDLNITFTYDPSKFEPMRECLNQVLAFAGVEIPGTQVDPPKGLKVHLLTDDPSVLRVGDGTGKSTTPVTEGTTDAKGHVKFALSGAPQIEKLPDQVAPKDLTEGVEASVTLKSNDLLADVLSLPWDVLDASSTGGLSLIPDMLARFGSLTYPAQVAVRDWSVDAQFEVTAKGEVTARKAVNETFSCGGISSVNRSTQEVGTFASDPVIVEAKLLDDPLDNRSDQAIVFVPQGSEFFYREIPNSGAALFTMPGHYSTEKTTASPGTGTMPETYANQSDCKGGGGGGNVPGNDIPPDCGVQTYDAALEVTIPGPHSLYVAGDQANAFDATGAPWWKNCGDPVDPWDPVVAPAYSGCDGASIVDGDMPSMKDILDPSKKSFTIEGSNTCRTTWPGELSEITYTWTLDFCRLNDGEPDC